MKEIKKQEAVLRNCISNKVASKGYNDGVDCLQGYNNVVCKDVDRYNADVDASNECDARPSATQALTEIDCMKLLKK